MWASVTDWLHAPFKSQMSATDVVLLTGLVIVAAAMWAIVLNHLKRELT